MIEEDLVNIGKYLSLVARQNFREYNVTATQSGSGLGILILFGKKSDAIDKIRPTLFEYDAIRKKWYHGFPSYSEVDLNDEKLIIHYARMTINSY